MQKIFRIRRFNPESKTARYQDYPLEVKEGWVVLDALNAIKWSQDGSLTFRKSCRSAICGSCAVAINYRNGLACKTQIKSLKSRVIVIEPLPGFPVIKDLVVDLDNFYQKFLKIKPWLISKSAPPAKELRQSPRQQEKFDEQTNCILCAACTSACAIFRSNQEYLGPAALTKAWRFCADSRDEGKFERLALVEGELGVFRCHTLFNCGEVCPKKITPTSAIQRLKIEVFKRRLLPWLK